MRVSARITGAALVVTAALALTGCNGSTGGSHSGKHKSGSSSHARGTTSGGTTTGGSHSSVSTSAIKGDWESGSLAKNDYVSLMLLNEQNGVVVTTLQASCTGDFADQGRYVKIHTTCRNGHGFESGTVTSYRNGKLTVAWDGGKTEEFTRVKKQ